LRGAPRRSNPEALENKAGARNARSSQALLGSRPSADFVARPSTVRSKSAWNPASASSPMKRSHAASASGASVPSNFGVTPSNSAIVFKAVRMVRRERGLSWAR